MEVSFSQIDKSNRQLEIYDNFRFINFIGLNGSTSIFPNYVSMPSRLIMEIISCGTVLELANCQNLVFEITVSVIRRCIIFQFIDPLLEAQMKAEEEARLEALKPKPVPKECTVMVIKPDAVEAGHVDEILEKVRENGFEIVQAEERLLSETDVRTMYEKHQEEVSYTKI